MSRLKPESEYEKTGAFHFFRWLSGSKDPYAGEVEMKPQKRIETSAVSYKNLTLPTILLV